MAEISNLGLLKTQEWNQLQECADRVEQALVHVDAVDLTSFLPPAGTPQRLVYLHELIKTEMEIRCKKHKAVSLEKYLERYPELGSADTLPADLIYEEYRLRHRYLDKPSLEIYHQRFPKQFEALKKLEKREPVNTVFDTFSPENVTSSCEAIGNLKPTPAPQASKVEVSKTPPPVSSASSARSPVASSSHDWRLSVGYQEIERLGKGQFGEVYRGLAPGGIPVAIKKIFREVDDESSQRELKALERIRELRHPYLLQTHNYSISEDRLIIVMELADGTLMDRFKECKAVGQPGIPAEELLTYFLEAAEALDYLHSQKLMHRDIKPQNLLRLKGHAKVGDFGIAREQEHSLDQTQHAGGTPAYMAPEMFRNQISVHGDQYSLAITWYEMRTGQRAITGKHPMEIMLQHFEGKPDVSRVPDAEQAVIVRALAKNPDERYPSCKAFADALAEVIRPKTGTMTGSQEMGTWPYQKLECIGKGQYGEVYKGLASGGIPVAIKVLIRPVEEASSQRELAALERLRELRHPFLLQMHNYAIIDRRLNIVMELADGSLQDRFDACVASGQSGIPVEELLPYFSEAASALDYLHSQKLTHRDIKPQNLMHLKGHAKVADFGIARPQENAVDQTFNIGGTPAYLPPEMWNGKISTQSDQYSLALTWYEMRMGKRVFTGSNHLELRQQHLSEKPNLSNVPEAEQQVLLRALAKSPDQRYPSCQHFVKALNEAIHPKTTPRSSRLLKALVGALAIALVIMGLLLTYYLNKPPTTPPTIPPTDEVFWQPKGWEPVKEDGYGQDADEHRFYKRLRKNVDGINVDMVLVTKDDLDKDPATFYIMETKVWNALYAKFDSDPKYKAKLTAEINQWKQGGNDAKSGKPLGEIGALNDQFPVYRVTVTQAYFFAQWLGEDGLDSDTECRLPNRKQWMKAAGYPDAGRAGPFRGTIDDFIKAGDEALMGSPKKVGKSERDRVDKTCCRDMACNGYEWTCDVLIPEGKTVPLDATEREDAKVLVMGQSYFGADKPLTYKDMEDKPVPQDYAKANPETSFRVILVRRSGTK